MCFSERQASANLRHELPTHWWLHSRSRHEISLPQPLQILSQDTTGLHLHIAMHSTCISSFDISNVYLIGEELCHLDNMFLTSTNATSDFLVVRRWFAWSVLRREPILTTTRSAIVIRSRYSHAANKRLFLIQEDQILPHAVYKFHIRYKLCSFFFSFLFGI